MKELSIEEKAKRYDEALEKAKAYDEALERAKTSFESANGMILKKWLVGIFPELKESEDERIINLLKMVVEKWHNVGYADYVMDIPKSDILSWLEKQCKQKTYGRRKECVDCQFNYDGECKGSCAMKRDEQKPVTWSEEDETGLTNTIIMLKEGASLHFNRKNITKALDWLKSLKERVQPQPKQEWSENDSLYYDDISEILINLLHSETANINKNAIKKDLDWFMSLKPHDTWKPNDKQMEVLWKYAEQNNYDGFILTSLHEQLKKLREK